MCNKEAIQAIFDKGLQPLYQAIIQEAKTSTYQTFGTKEHNPVEWYISKHLNWQAVTSSIAWVFTEHHGALKMPNAWVMFLGRLDGQFRDLGRNPKVTEVAVWLESERAQAVLSYELRENARMGAEEKPMFGPDGDFHTYGGITGY